jgi:TolB-like protein/Flp pilus assembly protein TadD
VQLPGNGVDLQGDAQAPAAAQLSEGSRVGPYEVLALIGRGGMGEVYRARDTRLSREVALKVLLPELASQGDAAARFEQEARAASALNHPAILTIHDIGRLDGMLYIVSELVSGQTLRELLARGPLPLPLLLTVAAQVGAGLAKAHAAGVVHRDIKPENVMLADDGFVRILDFGLAKLRPADAGGPVGPTTLPAGRLRGTVAYMSPEQSRGEVVDFRSDQFSLGALLYELAAGQPAFARASMAETLAAILHLEPVPLAQLRPETPLALQRVIARCLAKEAAARFPRTDELAAALAGLRPDSTADAGEPPHKPGRWRLAGPALFAMVVLVGSAFALLSRRAPPAGPAPATSLAVLPFKALDGVTEPELGLGMADALITRFAATRRLTVRPTSAVRDYGRAGQDARAAGRALGVEVVLDGHLQKADRLRLTLQLLRVGDGALLWADKLDEPLAGIADLQDSIADKVVKALAVVLTGEERSRLLARGTDNAEANRHYLKGRFYWNQRNDPSTRKALEHFRTALDLDPGYAQAWAGVSDAYMVLAPFAMPPVEAFPLARAAARKALEIEDGLAEAHASLGHVQVYLREWSSAEAAFRRAIELNPTYATALHWYGGLLVARGRTEEAIRAITAAHDADPLSQKIVSDLGLAYYFGGQPARAAEHCRQQLQLERRFAHTHHCLALALLALGRHDEAIAALRQAEALGAPQADALAYAYGLAGRTREARAKLDEIERPRAGFVPPYGIALAQLSLGEREPAFAALEKAYTVQDGELIMMAVDPRVRPLRDDPRFVDLLRRMGLQDVPPGAP